MRLTVLGCAGTAPVAESPCSAYLVEADGFRLLVDLGSGALAGLQRHGALLAIDAIVISHLHGDHWLDLVPYAYVRNFHPHAPQAPLTVFAPAGLAEALIAVTGPTGNRILATAYAVNQIVSTEWRIGPFRVVAAPTNHPVPTYALRVAHGSRSVTYSADTGVCEALVSLAAGTDLFVCEASFTDGSDEPPDVHLNGGQAGEYARRADVGALLLTHLLPWTDRDVVLAAARRAFAGPITMAFPGLSMQI